MSQAELPGDSADDERQAQGYSPSVDSTTFIEVSGGLLTEQTVESLRQERFDNPAVTPETFALPGEEPPTEKQLEQKIALAWEDLKERWDTVAQDGEVFEMDVSEARTKWILKLFEALGYDPEYQRANTEVSGLEFDLSHRGWKEHEMGGVRPPVLHMVEPSAERDEAKRDPSLDKKPQERGAKSPHDKLQNFLNASSDDHWAVVTNGITLRVLRDYYHTYTRGYVEFDLENIFESRNYADFRALFRLCHASRFVPKETDEEDEEKELPLEQLYQTSLSTGVKIGQDLQSNVVDAIETLGNGLLNPEIREFLREGGEEEAQEYYQEVLVIVYRKLFLLYAEQRGMMPGRDSLYASEYSMTKMRERAEERRGQEDRNTDLWHGLEATFSLVEEGDETLGVPCYNGMLFDSDRLEHVSETECPNDALLEAVASLTLVEREGALQRISYADLGVEEVGAIYESLLEFTPRLAQEHVDLEDREVPAGEFYLDDRGLERKETGSYYTDQRLVQELIKSALEPVVDDRLSAGMSRKEQEEALLDIKVCDPACGSAAFLIAANNYLGKELAEIRSESDYPLEEEIREARRDVLQHCIYGVDKNPMAVELAKVSLWIDSLVEDKPLNFLDHRIKCGDSLIGTTTDLVDGEFPSDAYETSSGRDWHVGNDLRKRVRNENKELSSGNNSSLTKFGALDHASIAEQLDDIEEDTVEDIHRKEEKYREVRESESYRREKRAFDAWTAAFFFPMREGEVSEYPTPETIKQVREKEYSDLTDDLQDMVERAQEIAEDVRFFHWELEYPEVFADGGFDCVLGNPP